MTSVRPDVGAPSVTEATVVRLGPLSMRPEGESWVIGRVETGDFISVPQPSALISPPRRLCPWL
jgi:hypothetical protein